MESLKSYQTNYDIFEVGESFSNGDDVLYILDIFPLYGDIYVSYSFKSELNMFNKKVSDFLITKSNYPTKIINPITSDNNLSCGCDKIESNE